jgi:hypothetical protein
VWCNEQGRTFGSVADTNGTGWALVNRTNDGGAVLVSMIAYLNNADAGDHDLTFNIAGGTATGYVEVIEESEVTTDAYVSGQSAGAGGYVGSQASGDVTPSQADCTVYGFGAQYIASGAGVLAQSAPWTDLTTYESGIYNTRIARQEPGDTDPIGVTWAKASGTSPIVSQVVVLKQSASGSTQPPRTYYSNRRRRL